MARGQYALDETPRAHVARSYPAKGERIGIRGGEHGQQSARYGFAWTPATVERMSETHLYVVAAGSGVLIAFHMSDPWEWQRAADCVFWTRCWKCNGIGEVVEHAGGGDFVGVCQECDGWVDMSYDPWRAPAPMRGAKGERVYVIPKDADAKKCPRKCGAVVYWIEAPRSGKPGTVNLPIDPSVSGGVEPDAFTDGRGVNHFTVCTVKEES